MKRFSGKKLLMLGTSTSSVELVQYARSEGAYVFVIDYLPVERSAAKQVADESALISVMDVDAVCAYAVDKTVDGVFCGVSEPILIVLNEVTTRLNLPCYFTMEQWKVLSDKEMFKAICRKYDVPVVPDYLVNYQEGNYNFAEMDFPLVVKPVDGSGSRGISVCHDSSMVAKAVEKALAASSSKRLLFEKYMTDAEVVIYYAFQDGKPILTTMCDRYTNKEQGSLAQLPTAYVFPSKHLDVYIKHFDRNVKKMFQGVGIKNGVMFIQSFVKQDGTICVYENGFRLNGAQEHYIVDQVCGFDAKKAMINYALCGTMGDVDIESLCDPSLHGKYACKLSPLIGKGTIAAIIGLDGISEIPSVVKVVKNHEVNDTIANSDLGTLKQIAYRAFIVEDSLEGLKKTIDHIQDNVSYLDIDGKSMMMQKFDTSVLDDYMVK